MTMEDLKLLVSAILLWILLGLVIALVLR